MKKKTFMAAQGNRVFAYASLCFLFASVVGLGFAQTASAFGPTPIYDKPIVTLLIPENYFTVGNQTTILFSVAMPQTWASTVDGTYGLWGTIRNVTCTLDQKQILFNDTVYGRDAKPVTVGSTTYYPPNSPTSINYSCSLNETAIGPHNLSINVSADTYAMNWETVINGYHYPHYYNQDVSTNETFSFNVAAPSTPSPTPSPMPTPSVSPTPEIAETTVPSPSPSVPEFPAWTFLPLFLLAFTGALLYSKSRRAEGNLSPEN